MNNSFDLERFKSAQDVCYHRVKAELKAGHKRSHWIWYVFPQIKGLGQSSMDATYAIQSIGEARAYLNDPLLFGRLNECVELLLANSETDIQKIMGNPDDLKLRSSMTLFSAVTSESALYKQVINKYYNGQYDALTLTIMSEMD